MAGQLVVLSEQSEFWGLLIGHRSRRVAMPDERQHRAESSVTTGGDDPQAAGAESRPVCADPVRTEEG